LNSSLVLRVGSWLYAAVYGRCQRPSVFSGNYHNTIFILAWQFVFKFFVKYEGKMTQNIRNWIKTVCMERQVLCSTRERKKKYENI